MPQYNLLRIFQTALIGLVFGAAFWWRGKER